MANCQRSFVSAADVRDHIVNVHRKTAEEMPCGEYTINTDWFLDKHRANCDHCEHKNDAGSNTAGTPEADPREGEAPRDSRNQWIIVNGSNHGIIYVLAA
ncbi:uncharacterized protein ColSpa_12569 [Colletotrichum spaethianum]|uniref:C2H2-type domain-containing protein n=1 Tax=Colletotrichum spaethianum TaxID=700344 RepID=A0AA37PHE6_9PEZI|nr:uncharacterized protein ColSpa_12569 [Colletotrichum spaethianum]GKT52388.1 hypothetical protein ColSpa_12569 [Colletotrichum spaethianum]